MLLQGSVKVAKGDPLINYDYDYIFGATNCHQKATLVVVPEYLSEFCVFCTTHQGSDSE